MSLRVRLFSLLGALVIVLIVAQWLWVRSLAADLSVEVGEVAVWAGSSVARFLSAPESCDTGPGCDEPACEGDGCIEVVAKLDKRVEVLGFEREAADSEPPAEIQRRLAKLTEALRQESNSEGPHAVRVEIRTTQSEEPSEEELGKFLVHVADDANIRYLSLKGPHIEHHFPIPESGLTSRLEEFSQRLLAGSLGLLGVGFVLAGFIAHQATRPLRQLADASRQVGAGALGTRVEGRAAGEVGEAITAFNSMSDRLVELDRRNRELLATRHLGEIGEIARGLAHSLRNPLNALGLSVEELGSECASEDRGRELVGSARRQIRRLDRSLQAFLALASEGRGNVARVDVEGLVRDVALEAIQDCRSRIRVEVSAAAGLESLPAIEPELRAVVQALVNNAIEASEAGTRVEIGVEPGTATSHRIVVDDRGSGLPESVRQHLFTPHVSTKATGSGMGLYLAHRVASNRYGGSLELIDRDGGGTRAVLELGPRLDEHSEVGIDESRR